MTSRLLAGCLLLLAACSPRVVYVPVTETHTVTETKHDTIVTTFLPPEATATIARDTTATAETSVALAVASYNGEAQKLTLTLQNKTTPVKVRTEYVERVIRDSIPYPVEVIKEAPAVRAPWYTGVLTVIAAAAVIALLLLIVFTRLKC